MRLVTDVWSYLHIQLYNYNKFAEMNSRNFFKSAYNSRSFFTHHRASAAAFNLAQAQRTFYQINLYPLSLPYCVASGPSARTMRQR